MSIKNKIAREEKEIAKLERAEKFHNAKNYFIILIVVLLILIDQPLCESTA